MARRVSWTNNSTGHTGTYVYRAPTLDPQALPTPVATVDPVVQGETAEWIDNAEVFECYAVQDFDGQGVGALSDEVCASAPAVESRYWRVRITKRQEVGAAYYSLSQVQFRSTAGVAETNSGTASASATLSGTYSANNLFDGDPSTIWLSNNTTVAVWVAIDLGSLQEKVELALQAPPTSGEVGRCPEDFEIQTSSNGIDWQTIKSLVGEPPWSPGEIREYPI